MINIIKMNENVLSKLIYDCECEEDFLVSCQQNGLVTSEENIKLLLKVYNSYWEWYDQEENKGTGN